MYHAVDSINMTSTKMQKSSHGAAPPSTIPLPKARRGFRSFVNDVVSEMRKVTWPKPAETNRLVGVVLAVCLFTVAFLTALGIAIQTIFNIVLGRA